ncbi:MAG: YbaB/EbfC family nucleoid-associated protein [Rickettsiales bacterium]|jgi:DNA-binding YbaB/EbfC family protein|nr:YbaB/EbfC family nucleoid-associated protein [Rickettsiales bacterium]
MFLVPVPCSFATKEQKMDMNALMEQAKQLQAKVAAAQDNLGATVVKGIAGNGLVIVDMTGKYDLLKLTLSPDLLKKDLAEITALITAAFNDAKAKADATIDKVMGEATAGMPMPE